VEHDCPYHEDMQRRIEVLEHRVTNIEETGGSLSTQATRYEEQLKTLFKTVDEIKQLLEKQNLSFVAALSKMEAAWTARFDVLQTDVENLKGKPGRFMDGAVMALVTAIIAGIAGYVFGGR